jgi:hypothetical protein
MTDAGFWPAGVIQYLLPITSSAASDTFLPAVRSFGGGRRVRPCRGICRATLGVTWPLGARLSIVSAPAGQRTPVGTNEHLTFLTTARGAPVNERQFNRWFRAAATTMAATNKYLAQSNKSRRRGPASNKTTGSAAHSSGAANRRGPRCGVSALLVFQSQGSEICALLRQCAPNL